METSKQYAQSSFRLVSRVLTTHSSPSPRVSGEYNCRRRGTPWVIGLRNASVLYPSATWMGRGRTSAPEMTYSEMPPSLTLCRRQRCVGRRIYDLGGEDGLLYSMLFHSPIRHRSSRGRAPLSDMTEITAMCSMLNGARLPGPRIGYDLHGFRCGSTDVHDHAFRRLPARASPL